MKPANTVCIMFCSPVLGFCLLVSTSLVACKDIPINDGYYSCDPEKGGACPPEMICEWSNEDGEYRCFRRSDGSGFCGNDTVDHGEQCDGPNLGGRTCQYLGHPGGQLACSESCTYDRSGCDPPATCGDKDVDPPVEQCDGEDLDGFTCQLLGFDGGALACASNCIFDTSGCRDCLDGDFDGHSGYDAERCPTGDDFCDNDPDNWTIGGCASCIDNDGDGYGTSCDKGTDCNDNNGTIWVGCASSVWIDLSAGWRHTCGLKDNGGIWCWGDNAWGQLGDGQAHQTCDGMDCSLRPAPAAGFGDFVEVASGRFFNCARRADGTVWCWGANNMGQLGDGLLSHQTCYNGSYYFDCSPTAVRVLGITGAKAIGAGEHFACAIKTDATVWCWGRNDHHQLGDGKNHLTCSSAGSEYDCYNIPVQVVGTGDPVAIEGGESWAFTREADGTMFTWGYSAATATQVLNISSVSGMGLGNYHQCAVKSNGTAWCWGSNDYGQCGVDDFDPVGSPEQVLNLAGVLALDGGYLHTCAVKDNGSVYCFGMNPDGSYQNVPLEVPFMPNAVGVIALGSKHSCVLKSDASAWCWGGNMWGQLGDDTGVDSMTPVEVWDP